MGTNAGTRRQAAVARNPPQISWPGYPVSCRRSIAFVLHASRHCHDDQTMGGLLALLGTVLAGLTLNFTGQRLTAMPPRWLGSYSVSTAMAPTAHAPTGK